MRENVFSHLSSINAILENIISYKGDTKNALDLIELLSLEPDNELEETLIKDYDKLKEEVEEYLADYSVEEMADVMEVIYAILEYRGTSMEEVEQVRIKKRNRKGAFKNKIFLKDVEED